MPVIGHILFAENITPEGLLIHQRSEFKPENAVRYYNFPYSGIENGTIITYSWSKNNVPLIEINELWNDEEEGIATRAISNPGLMNLDPGRYQLIISVKEKELTSANFSILKEPDYILVDKQNEPRETMIDPSLIPAWEILSESESEYIHEFVNFTSLYNIPILLLSDDPGAIAVYRYEIGSEKPGMIVCSQEREKNCSREEFASIILHEMVHARQHLSEGGNFTGCTIEHEYYAYLSELYLLDHSNRTDILHQKWSGIYDVHGKLDKNLLWKVLKNVYDTCPPF